MVHHHRVNDLYLEIYLQLIKWHLFAEEPLSDATRDMKAVAKSFWPREYRSGSEDSAYLRGTVESVPLLKRKNNIASFWLIANVIQVAQQQCRLT